MNTRRPYPSSLQSLSLAVSSEEPPLLFLDGSRKDAYGGFVGIVAGGKISIYSFTHL
jgi:hypothetical protein